MVIVGQDGVSPVYGNAAIPVTPGKAWTYRVYFGKDPVGFANAWGKDELEVGKALGYPPCCSIFFNWNWKQQGWRDLVYPMMQGQDRITGPHTCNILLRHIGVRATFHLPCSFDCPLSDIAAKRILKHGRETGFTEEMHWIEEMLNWPVRWSSLHGVTIVTTPILKIIFSSDALSTAVVYDREGPSYPDEGASGVDFPFRMVKPMALKGIEDTWSDNGFSSLFAMRHSHDSILNAIGPVPLGKERVLDLGCGNGALLKRIQGRNPDIKPVGVEIDEAKCSKASLLGFDIYWSDIVRTDAYLVHDYHMILVSINRLMELNATLFLSKLSKHTKFLVVYGYQGWYDSMNDVINLDYELVSKTKTPMAEVRLFRVR